MSSRPLSPPYAAIAGRGRRLDFSARSRWQAYAFAVTATLATLAARLVANFEIGDQPIVIAFVIPIVLSAIIGGIGPGLVATAVAAVVAPYFLFAPQYSFAIAKASNAIAWLAMVAIGVLTSVLIDALHRSRRRVAAAERLSAVMLASIGDAVMTTDVDGRVVFLNAEAERLTGWSSAQAAGQRLADVLRIVHAGSREPLADPVQAILGAVAPVSLAHGVVLIARDGRELAIDDSGAPIRGPDGAVRGAVIVFRDCSAHRGAEEALRESEERLRLAQDTAGVGVFDFDLASGRLTWSASLERIYGVAPGAVGRYEDWRRCVHPDDVDRVEREWRRAVETGRPMELEFRIVRASGDVRWVSAKGTACHRADGTPYRVLGVNVDISDRKRSEDEARRAYDVLTLAQRASHSGVWDFDFATGVTYCSPEYCDLYGLPRGTTMDRDGWLGHVHAEDRERMRAASRKLLSEGVEWSVEFRIEHPTRGERWLAGRATLTREAGGRPIRITGADMDITDHRRAQEAMLASELRFRTYVEDSPIAMFVASPDARIVDCNPKAAELLGCDTATLRNMRAWELIAPEERDRAAQALHDVVEHGRVAAEFRALRQDDRPLWVSLSGVRLADGHLMAFCTDITARRRAETALRDSEARFRLLIESLPQLVWTCAPEGSCDYVNPQLIAYTGVAVPLHLGAGWLDFVHADDRPAVAAAWGDARERGIELRRELRMRRHDGAYRWFDARAVPLRDESGGIVKWFGAASDIDDARELREALRTSRSQLLAALDAGGMGAWMWDVSKDRFEWDESVLRVIGIEASEAARTDFAGLLDFIHSADRERVRTTIDALLREGTHASGEYRIAQSDGAMRWIEYTVRVERDAVGRAARVIGINVDITQRKRAEQTQLRSQKLEALGTLAGGIAHDFNNILVAITGNTKLAKGDLPRGHPAQESLDEIARAGARAVDLVRRILTFSRPYDHKREVMALAPAVDEALKLVRATLPAMVQIRTRYGDDLPPVSFDPTQIHQIIVNLATNASHAFGAHGGHIDVRVDAAAVGPDFASHTPGLREGRYVRLEVDDDGCGMDRATLERIFDPFFTTKPQGLGTGLGLSVVHGIVKSHDGAISVYSEPGRGTSFRIYFPAVESADERARTAPRDAPRSRSAHVLFVDDEAPLVMLVSRMLERIGYRVTGVSDATRALAEFHADPERFDAIVTDLAMGDMSGFDLARDVLSVRPDLPVVMTSGFIRPEDQQAAAALGVRALILKPDTVEELGYVLNRVLRQRADGANGSSERIADPLA